VTVFRPAARQSAERRGRRSELFAALLLLAKGYRVLGRRVRTKAGEIDLIARSPRGVLCFVEVKFRERQESAREAVRMPQQLRIARAAQLYLARYPALAAGGVRFDLVTVARGRLPRHLPDAWQAQE